MFARVWAISVEEKFTEVLPSGMKFDYELAVIGGGSAGLTAAGFAASLGFKVLLIESEKVGGDCTWHGCIPSKTLIHAANNVKGNVKNVNFQSIRELVHRTVDQVYAMETPEELQKKGVEVITGRAEITSNHRITVHPEGIKVSFKSLCIATGARPKVSNLTTEFNEDGNMKSKILNYINIWNIEDLPESLAVVGGGPIGSELAQAFSRLGSSVTIFSEKLLPNENESTRAILENVFENEGIRIIRSKVARIEKHSNTDLAIVISASGERVEVGKILLATGRSPVIPDGFENVCDTSNNGGIIVDEFLRCKRGSKIISNFFAAGDCIHGNEQFTHYAGKQGYICARNALLVGKARGLTPAIVPRATFTSPEVASVGFPSVEAARNKGFKDAVLLSMSGNKGIDRAITDNAGESTLFELIISDGVSTNATVIGATIVAEHAGEVLATTCLVIAKKIPIIQFAEVMLPYPTYSFGIMQMVAEEVTQRFAKSRKAKVAKKLKAFF